MAVIRRRAQCRHDTETARDAGRTATAVQRPFEKAPSGPRPTTVITAYSPREGARRAVPTVAAVEFPRHSATQDQGQSIINAARVLCARTHRVVGCLVRHDTPFEFST